MPVPGVVAADLVLVEAGLVLGGLEALLDGLITNGKFCCVRRLRHPVWNNREAILAMDFYVTIGTGWPGAAATRPSQPGITTAPGSPATQKFSWSVSEWLLPY